jgi:hypothetical protein
MRSIREAADAMWAASAGLRLQSRFVAAFVRNNVVLTSPRTKRIGGPHSVESQK